MKDPLENNMDMEGKPGIYQGYVSGLKTSQK